MFTLKFIFAPLFLLVIRSAPENLPTGNFAYFGPCVIKFVKLSEAIESVDQTERLIHANNPTSLVFTVSGRFNFPHKTIQDLRNVLDFNFFETCTVTVFINFGAEDNPFRIFYIYYSRDTNRAWKHSVFILISKLPPEKLKPLLFTRIDYLLPNRMFLVHLNISNLAEIEWFFVCFYCKRILYPVKYTRQVRTLTMHTLQVHFTCSNRCSSIYSFKALKKVFIPYSLIIC